MNTIISAGKSILNALAFANVNRIDELHMELNQIDATVSASGDPSQHRTNLSSSNHTGFTPSTGHIQGAL
jgi:hypothetical protein